ncbi:GNAT family N-acetyltransferase [Paenibacillus jilunlii]|uniref:Acetyltransferase (GNAT) domain-containing protein n=1 Tax=Paenibacillus jilunlii TaxID=682956 RepID=A0A1G9RSH6_9BACL|nr:GNAT family N-acetyltransferase [Paenibacillus jilunlii]KWX78088.1 hypothetical protein AML91_06340 [Paenibacillus jilunlii]SDM26171.1 Acetyltransferase (GNAT) domain-containing protein [Paenibacillus jilunlii]
MGDIRFVSREELKKAAELSDLVFRDEEQTSMAAKFPGIFSGSYLSSPGVFEDGQLVAFAGLVPGYIQMGPVSVPVFSLGSVCTYPEYRGKGYANALLQRVFDHIDRAGSSLLLVSGTRDLYIRQGCHTFGSVHSYLLSTENEAVRKAAAGPAFVREAEERDWFGLQKLAESREVRYDRSLYELAALVRAEAIADIYKLKQKIYVAESEGCLQAYAIIAVRDKRKTEAVPLVIEWGGAPEAALQAISWAVAANEISELQLPVPWHETGMIQALGSSAYRETPNPGTVKIVSPVRLWLQIQPYLQQKSPEALSGVELHYVAPGGETVLTVNGTAVHLNDKELISLFFDTGPQLELPAAIRGQLKELFPVPLPYASGLNFV